MYQAFVNTNQNYSTSQNNILLFNYSLLYPPFNFGFFSEIIEIDSDNIFKLKNIYTVDNNSLKSFSNQIITLQSFDDYQLKFLKQIINPTHFSETGYLSLNIKNSIPNAKLTYKNSHKLTEVNYAPFTINSLNKINLFLKDTAAPSILKPKSY